MWLLNTCLQARIQEKLEYEDLAATISTSSDPALNLTHMDRYLHGPTPVTATQYNTTQDILNACHIVQQQVHTWQPNLTQVRPANTYNSPFSIYDLGEVLFFYV